MDNGDFIDFIEFVEELEDRHERLPKRYIRDMEDPFNFYEDLQFKIRYRFSKETIRNIILPLVEDQLAKDSQRGLPFTPLHQILIALRFYATGDFQIVNGDLRGVSQSSVSLIIKRVSIALAGHLGDFICFPNNILQQQENIRRFHQISNFPNVSGCIDGTHILIKNPGGNIGETFRNRKGQFSLNIQVVCGPNMEILDIVARYPGSTHDNVIFERSGLRVRWENNEIPGILLGDNGYACRRYLLTPVINPVTQSEQNYNRSHIRTRNMVERVFGIWKRRFPCLRRVLLTKVETSTAIICATAILHNIARNQNDYLVDDELDNGEMVDNIIIAQNNLADGLAFRRAFIITHF